MEEWKNGLVDEWNIEARSQVAGTRNQTGTRNSQRIDRKYIRNVQIAISFHFIKPSVKSRQVG